MAARAPDVETATAAVAVAHKAPAVTEAMVEDKDIGFVIPKEGSQLNSDNLCIPKGAPHPKNAHAFINYLLDAEVDKKITETILFPTPNAAAAV